MIAVRGGCLESQARYFTCDFEIGACQHFWMESDSAYDVPQDFLIYIYSILKELKLLNFKGTVSLRLTSSELRGMEECEISISVPSQMGNQERF